MSLTVTLGETDAVSRPNRLAPRSLAAEQEGSEMRPEMRLGDGVIVGAVGLAAAFAITRWGGVMPRLDYLVIAGALLGAILLVALDRFQRSTVDGSGDDAGIVALRVRVWYEAVLVVAGIVGALVGGLFLLQSSEARHDADPWVGPVVLAAIFVLGLLTWYDRQTLHQRLRDARRRC